MCTTHFAPPIPVSVRRLTARERDGHEAIHRSSGRHRDLARGRAFRCPAGASPGGRVERPDRVHPLGLPAATTWPTPRTRMAATSDSSSPEGPTALVGRRTAARSMCVIRTASRQRSSTRIRVRFRDLQIPDPAFTCTPTTTPEECENTDFSCPAWSPDGSRLACSAFSGVDPSRSGIYTIRSSDGGGLTLVKSCPPACAGVGDYSPDGKRLVLVGSDQNDQLRIFTVKLNGSGFTSADAGGHAPERRGLPSVVAARGPDPVHLSPRARVPLRDLDGQVGRDRAASGADPVLRRGLD